MSLYTSVFDTTKRGNILILDGGTGTELEKRGVPMDPGAWCGVAALEHEDLLKQIHLDYIFSGADVITTNTYSSSRHMLELSGLGQKFSEINKKALEAAHKAREASGKPNVLIAGSLSHRGMISEGTAMPDQNAVIPLKKFEESLTELAYFLKEEGCDLIILEMMYDPTKIEPTFIAAEKAGLPIWAGFSSRRDNIGRLLSFLPDEELPLMDIFRILSNYKPDAAGIMHTPSNAIQASLKELKKVFSGTIFAYPDSGYFKSPNWQFEKIISEQALQDFAGDWIKEGTKIIGGCCGLSPSHIQALARIKQNPVE
tara:strand:+ start:2210 stop:3148 length:939 start_codon:yes stop_codon:yes gene_type:complete